METHTIVEIVIAIVLVLFAAGGMYVYHKHEQAINDACGAIVFAAAIVSGSLAGAILIIFGCYKLSQLLVGLFF